MTPSVEWALTRSRLSSPTSGRVTGIPQYDRIRVFTCPLFRPVFGFGASLPILSHDKKC